MLFKFQSFVLSFLVITLASSIFAADCPNGSAAKSVSLQSRGVYVDSRSPNSNFFGTGTVSLGEVTGSQLGLWQFSVPSGVDMSSIFILQATVQFPAGSSPGLTDSCQGSAKVSGNLSPINPATVTYNTRPSLYPAALNGDCPNVNGYSTLSLVNMAGQQATRPVPLDVTAAIQLSLQNNRQYLGFTLQSVYKYIFLSSDVATLTVRYCERSQQPSQPVSGSQGCAALSCPSGTTCYQTQPNYAGGPAWAVCCNSGFIGCGRPGGLFGICINAATQTCCYPSGTAQVIPIACNRGQVCRSLNSNTAVCQSA